MLIQHPRDDKLPEKIIYSVGRDLQDDGGSSALKNGRKRDLFYPLDFQGITNQ